MTAGSKSWCRPMLSDPRTWAGIALLVFGSAMGLLIALYPRPDPVTIHVVKSVVWPVEAHPKLVREGKTP